MKDTLLEILGNEPIEHEVFAQSPLALAVCQIRFTPLLSISTPEFVAPFQQAIEDRFPVLRPNKQVSVELEMGPGGPKVRTDETAQWRFSDPEDTWIVILSSEFVTLETRAYRDFSDFVDRLRYVLDALDKHIRPKIGLRIGLRYINEIRYSQGELPHIVADHLLGPLSTDRFAQATQIAVQEIKLELDESEGITIRHGALPEGTTVQPVEGQAQASDLANPFYLLDFDIFREFTQSKPLDVKPDNITGYIREYNESVYQLFRWAVTEEYAARLRSTNGDAGD